MIEVVEWVFELKKIFLNINVFLLRTKYIIKEINTEFLNSKKLTF